MKTIIVSRHPAAISFVKTDPRFRDADVIAQAAESDVAGNIVAGNLPLRLAALCARYYYLEIPLSRDQRGTELGPEEMRGAGARLTRFFVLTADGALALENRARMDGFCGCLFAANDPDLGAMQYTLHDHVFSVPDAGGRDGDA